MLVFWRAATVLMRFIEKKFLTGESISEFCEDYIYSHQATMICGLAALYIACLHTWQVRIIEAALSCMIDGKTAVVHA